MSPTIWSVEGFGWFQCLLVDVCFLKPSVVCIYIYINSWSPHFKKLLIKCQQCLCLNLWEHARLVRTAIRQAQVEPVYRHNQLLCIHVGMLGHNSLAYSFYANLRGSRYAGRFVQRISSIGQNCYYDLPSWLLCFGARLDIGLQQAHLQDFRLRGM